MNTITDTTSARVQFCSSLERSGLTVDASNTSEILAVAGSVGVGRSAGIAGTVAINEITNTTEAKVISSTQTANGSTTRADVFNIKSKDTSTIQAIAGGIGASQNIGFGAALAYNDITNTASSVVFNSTLIARKDFSVTSENRSSIKSITAGAAGATNNSLAGSVSIDQIDANTTTDLSGSTITASGFDAAGSATVTATNTSTIESIAGALAGAGTNAVAAAVSADLVTNNTNVNLSRTVINLPTYPIAVRSTSNASIDAITAGGAGSGGGSFAAGGSVSVNTISTRTVVTASAASDLDGSSVVIRSSDDTSIDSIAGAVAGGGTTSVGASVALNTITADTNVVLSGSSVTATTGDVIASAETLETITSITAGGAAGSSYALGGALSLTTLTTTTDASIKDRSTVTANDTVLVSASNDLKTFLLAGAVAGAGTASLGASVGVLVTNNTTNAKIVNSTVVGAQVRNSELTGATGYTGNRTSSGSRETTTYYGVAVVATALEKMLDIAAGAAGAGNVGVAGSVDVTSLSDTTLASIDDNSTVDSFNSDVAVLASDRTELLGIGGAIAGGGTGGIGAGADGSRIVKNTTAIIGGDVDAFYDVRVNANASENVTAVGGAVGGGGSAGIAGAAAIDVWTINTRASISDPNPTSGALPLVKARGNVIIGSDHNATLNLIAGGAAVGGSGGVGASIALPIINETTEAFVGSSARVDALGNRGSADVPSGLFSSSVRTESADASVPARPGSTATVTSPQVKAPAINNSDATSNLLRGQLTVTPARTQATGLAITAINRNDLEFISGSGAGSGAISAAIAAGALILNNTTNATIGTGALINQESTISVQQGVLVAAGSSVSEFGVVGAAAVSGGGGAAPAAAMILATNTVKAIIDDSAQVKGSGEIIVRANAEEYFATISAGASGTGTLAIAGSINFLFLNNVTDAHIGKLAKVSGGYVLVDADDLTTSVMLTGAGALGLGGGGLAASAGLNSIVKNTKAYIDQDAEVVGAGYGNSYVTVSANSMEDIFGATVAGAGGYYASIAGAVSVNTLTVNTSAAVNARAKINPLTRTSAPGAVTVSATESLVIRDYNGTLAGGLVGGGAGSVDVDMIRGKTTATIAAGADVGANTLNVTAVATRDLQSYVASAAGGAAGLAGSISMFSVGNELSSDGSSALRSGASSVGSFIDTDVVGGLRTATEAPLGQYSAADRNGDDPAPDATQVLGLAVSDAKLAFSASARSDATGAISSTSDSATTATIADTVTVRYVNMNVTANETILETMVDGSVAIGATAIGGAIAMAFNGSNVKASVGGSLTGNSSAGIATVAATLTTTADLKTAAGTGGSFALGAQYSYVNDGGNATAELLPGANFIAGNAVAVKATANRNLLSNATGVNIGGLAAGLAYANATAQGTAEAVVRPGARFTGVNGNIDITAETTAITIATATGLSAGTIGAAAVLTTALSEPVAKATLPASTRIESAGRGSFSDVKVTAQGLSKASATSFGVGVGIGIGVGLSKADAFSSPGVSASIGNNSVIKGGAIAVNARHNLNANGAPVAGSGANATAIAGGGSFIGVGGSMATTISMPIVTATVGTGCTLTAVGTTSYIGIGADSYVNANSSATGVAIGFAGFGASIAMATSAGSTTASVGDVSSLNSEAFTDVRARAINTSVASAVAAAGGMIASTVNLSSAATNPTVSTTLGERVSIVAGTYVRILTDSEVHSNASTQGLIVGLASIAGPSEAIARSEPSVRTTVGHYDSIIAKTGQVMIDTNANAADPDAPSYFGETAVVSNTASLVGLLAVGLDATKTTLVSSIVPATVIGQFVSIIAGRDIAPGSLAGLLRISTLAGNDAVMNVTATAGGLFTVQGTQGILTKRTLAETLTSLDDRFQATDQLKVYAKVGGNLNATIVGGGGNTITDFLRTLFSGNLASAFSNPPSILSAGGSLLVVNTGERANVYIGSSNQLVGNAVIIGAYNGTTINGTATMRSKGSIVAEATSMVVVNFDADALVDIGVQSQISGVTVTIDADNSIAANVNASATVGVSLGGADATSISRLANAADSTDTSSSARINVGALSSVLASQSLAMNVATHQANPSVKLGSTALARADGGATANARALADGTVVGVAITNIGASATITAPTATIRGSASASNLQMDRKPIASASTIASRFVEQSRNVVDRIVSWLPWPLSSLVRFVSRVVREIVEVFDFSSATGTQGGNGVTYAAGLTCNGTITNATPANRRLVIDPRNFGPDPTPDNIGYHIDENGRIIVDPVAPNAPMHLLIDFGDGTVGGSGEILVHGVVENLEIVNNSDNDLVIGDLELVTGERGPGSVYEPQIEILSTSGTLAINRDIVRSHVFITDNGAGNVVLTHAITDAVADIHITAAHDIIVDPAAFIEFGEVGGLYLNAGGNIGTPMSPLTVRAIHAGKFPDGSLNGGAAVIQAVAGGNVYLNVIGENEIDSPVVTDRDEVGGIAIGVLAGGEIRINVPETDILDDSLVFHPAIGSYELTNVTSTGGDIHVTVNSGDLLVDHVSTPGNVTLIASRNILGTGSDPDIFAATVTLKAGEAIGRSWSPLLTEVATIAASSESGDIYIAEDSGITIGTGEGIAGVHAGGLVRIEAHSKLVINADVTAKGDVTLDLHDSEESGEVIELAEGVAVTSLFGNITLDAADDVYAGAGSQITTSGAVFIRADLEQADAGIGANVKLSGTIAASSISILTGEDNDTVDVSGAQLDSTHIEISTDAGDDTITGSSARENIDPGEGADSLYAGGGADFIHSAQMSDTLLSGNLLHDGSFDEYEFTLGEMQVLALEAIRLSGDVQCTLAIYNPSGALVFFGTGPAFVAAGQAGVYRVRVSSSAGSGDYELRSPELRDLPGGDVIAQGGAPINPQPGSVVPLPLISPGLISGFKQAAATSLASGSQLSIVDFMSREDSIVD